MIERVGLITRDNPTIQTVYCHVHQTELGIVFHLFLTVEGHLCIGIHTTSIHKVASLNEHTSRTTSRIKHYALFWLQYIYEHLYQRLRCEEHTIV